MIKYLLFSPISTINCHGSFEIFTNPLNPTTYLMVNSLKEIKGKQLNHKIQQFRWPIHLSSHLITCAFGIKIYSRKSS